MGSLKCSGVVKLTALGPTASQPMPARMRPIQFPSAHDATVATACVVKGVGKVQAKWSGVATKEALWGERGRNPIEL
jgi:hypothetical protein